MKENEYLEFVKNLPFGRNYLILRKKLAAIADERYRVIKEEVETKQIKEKKLTHVPFKPSLEEVKKLVREEAVILSRRG